MIELAACYDTGELVRVGKIAQENGIPPRFLVQILLQLKGTGLVSSVRGAAGGYRLVKPPREISLGDVMTVVDGQEELNSSATVDSPTVGVLMAAWHEIADTERTLLESTTLADLVDRVKRQSEPMYYI